MSQWIPHLTIWCLDMTPSLQLNLELFNMCLEVICQACALAGDPFPNSTLASTPLVAPALRMWMLAARAPVGEKTPLRKAITTGLGLAQDLKRFIHYGLHTANSNTKEREAVRQYVDEHQRAVVDAAVKHLRYDLAYCLSTPSERHWDDAGTFSMVIIVQLCERPELSRIMTYKSTIPLAIAWPTQAVIGKRKLEKRSAPSTVQGLVISVQHICNTTQLEGAKDHIRYALRAGFLDMVLIIQPWLVWESQFMQNVEGTAVGMIGAFLDELDGHLEWESVAREALKSVARLSELDLFPTPNHYGLATPPWNNTITALGELSEVFRNLKLPCSEEQVTTMSISRHVLRKVAHVLCFSTVHA